jgi:hypothetical protein
MYRFKTIPDIREGAPHDYAHRVVEITPAHFFFEGYRKCFLGKGIHKFRNKRQRLRTPKSGLKVNLGFYTAATL